MLQKLLEISYLYMLDLYVTYFDFHITGLYVC